MALGVYLRKFVVNSFDKDCATSIDTGSFGRFTLSPDPESQSDSLYCKKLIFEPSGGLAALTKVIAGYKASSKNQTSILES